MDNILEKKQYVETSVNLYFPRIIDIRKKHIEYEEALEDKYQIPPLMPPVPDNFDPVVPRFTFNSKLGHSQINFSQINAAFSVRYDNEYVKDYEKCENYILERLNLIFPLIKKETKEKIFYAGVINKLQYVFDKKMDKEIFDFLVDKFLQKNTVSNELHDFNLKLTIKHNANNYVNITFSNFRNYTVETPPTVSGVMKLPDRNSESVGMQVIVDVNDRRAFNEREDYFSSFEEIHKLLSLSKELVVEKIDKILQTGQVEL